MANYHMPYTFRRIGLSAALTIKVLTKGILRLFHLGSVFNTRVQSCNPYQSPLQGFPLWEATNPNSITILHTENSSRRVVPCTCSSPSVYQYLVQTLSTCNLVYKMSPQGMIWWLYIPVFNCVVFLVLRWQITVLYMRT